MDLDLRSKAEKLARRPYIIKVLRDQTTDDQPIYFARNPELEGCFGQGNTPSEATEDLLDARIDYILSLLEDGLPVPDPNRLSITSSTNVETIKITNTTSFPQKITSSWEVYAVVQQDILA